MLFNSTISFVGIHSRELHAHEHKEIPTESFSGALFVIAKTRQNVTATTNSNKTKQTKTNIQK